MRRSVSRLTKKTGAMILVIAVAPALARPASAAIITFDFSGTVTGAIKQNMAGNFLAGGDSVFAELDGLVSDGALVSGSYSFDSTVGDFDPGANVGGYVALTSFAVTIDGNTWTLGTSPFSFSRINVHDFPSFDSYSILLDEPGGPGTAEIDPEEFFLSLSDSTATAFSDTALPTVPPALSLFDDARFHLVFLDPRTARYAVGGSITSLTASQPDIPQTIPEPSVILLLGTGLLGLHAAGRRRRVIPLG